VETVVDFSSTYHYLVGSCFNYSLGGMAFCQQILVSLFTCVQQPLYKMPRSALHKAANVVRNRPLKTVLECKWIRTI